MELRIVDSNLLEVKTVAAFINYKAHQFFNALFLTHIFGVKYGS